MWKLPRPQHTADHVFTTCISKVRDSALKARLTGVTQAVSTASAAFEAAVLGTALHTIARQDIVGGTVSGDEMQAIYTGRMAKKGAPGRDIYDEIMSSAQHGRCPLCGQRTVSTLDHHLPKSHYPSLSVAPLNLVPSCADCNKAKLANVPQQQADEPLHPYFEDIDAHRWLKAEVVNTAPAALRFFVEPPGAWGAVLTARVVNHFTVLGLGRLYGSQAAEELLNIRGQLVTLHAAGGTDLVRTEIRERTASCEAARLNGWRTAAYHALAESEWFCEYGFAMAP